MRNEAKRTGSSGLWLYVCNQTHRSAIAPANLKRICKRYLPGMYTIDVIDILEQPGTAKREQIAVIPTVVRRRPLPMRTVVGDLSSAAETVSGLDLQPSHVEVES